MQLSQLLMFVCLGLVSSVVSRSSSNCETVRPFFESKNVTVDFVAVTRTDLAGSKYKNNFNIYINVY